MVSNNPACVWKSEETVTYCIKYWKLLFWKSMNFNWAVVLFELRLKVVTFAVTPAMDTVLLVPFRDDNCVLRSAKSAVELSVCAILIIVTPLPCVPLVWLNDTSPSAITVPFSVVLSAMINQLDG